MQVIYLVRHATPDWNNYQLPYHLPPGPPLSTAGLQEAEKLGEYLLSTRTRRLITSPFERCLRTAQIVSGITEALVEVAPGIGEVQPGETEENLRLRVGQVLDEALRGNEHPSPIVLVTHGSPVASLLSLLGMGADDLLNHRTFDHGNPVPPAGAWRAVREDYNPEDSYPNWELTLVFVPDSGNQVSP
jgi:broad specificity phosphatase PhoE